MTSLFFQLILKIRIIINMMLKAKSIFLLSHHYHLRKRDVMIKYSRQRESIKHFLEGRKDHPTAETVYQNIKQEYPHISLGTVYRNLSLLAELGEIQKISTGTGPDRFDGNPMPHYHFICKSCGSVLDLHPMNLEHINILAGQDFDGEIEGHYALFFGKCPSCTKSEK